MKGMSKEALRQGGCVSSVCVVRRLIFHVAVCRAWPRQSYSLAVVSRERACCLKPRGGFLVESACKLPPN